VTGVKVMVYSVAMTKQTSNQPIYILFGLVIVVLIALIGYFAYLLLAPDKTVSTTSNTNTVANTNTVKNSNSTTNKNSTKKNGNTNKPTNDEGLVEPNSNDNTNTVNDNTNTLEVSDVVAKDGEEIITLYFPKSDSDCGTVFPVKRAVTPSDDFYGQIILSDMSGPADTETGYTSAIPSGLHLRRVEYTGSGPVVYVDEAYDSLDACAKQTASAQLIETANAMFDLPEGTSGEVIVGTPPEDTTDTTNTNSDTNSNTNTNY
jgi:hypothetical protein